MIVNSHYNKRIIRRIGKTVYDEEVDDTDSGVPVSAVGVVVAVVAVVVVEVVVVVVVVFGTGFGGGETKSFTSNGTFALIGINEAADQSM